MSLINDMLRDLERRRAPGTERVLSGVRPAGTPRRARPWFPWLLLLPVAIGGAVWWRLASAPRMPVETPAPAVVPVAAPAQVATPAPAQLRGISLSERDGLLRLELSLDRMVEHRLDRADGGRRLLLRLPDTASAVTLPRLDAGSAVRQLDLTSDGQGGLVLHLALAEAPTVQSSIERRGEGAALVVTAILPRPAVEETPAPVVATAAPQTPLEPAPPVTQATAPVEPAPVAKPEFHKAPAPPTPAEQAAQALAEGLRLQQTGDRAGAEAQFLRALALDPDQREARRVLALQWQQQAKHEQAASLLREGLARHPGDAVLADAYARVLLAQGQEAEALRALETVRSSDPDQLAFMAALYQRQGQALEAADHYGRALRQRPREGAWWVGLGISLEAAGQPARARDAYIRALQTSLADTDLKSYAEARTRALSGGH